QTIGLDPGAFVFGVFGYLRESKRIATVVDVFPEVHAAHPRINLLIAGDFVSAASARSVDTKMDGVVRVPYLSESDFWLAVSAIDACINLRYPAAGETSGIAVRMMGIGKPVLITDGEE